MRKIILALFTGALLAITGAASAHPDSGTSEDWIEDPSNPGYHVGTQPHTSHPLYYIDAANLVFDLDSDIPNGFNLSDRITYYDNQVQAIPDLSKGECENTSAYCLNVQKVNVNAPWALRRDLVAFGIKHGWVKINTHFINLNESWACTMIWFALQGHPHSGAGCSSVPHPSGVELTNSAEDIMGLSYAGARPFPHWRP